MTGDSILVVDDGRDMRDFVVEYVLEPNGYRWLVAEDGQQGLEVALAQLPDLILMDLQMPRLDGIGMLKAMKEHGLDIPVVLMTFHGSEEIAIDVFRLGVVDYVIKPFNVDELLEAFEQALTSVRLRRERDELTERLIASNRRLKRRLKELQALYGVGKSLAAQVEMDTLLTRVVDAAAFVTGAPDIALMLLDAKSGELVKRAVKSGEAAPALVLNTTTDQSAREVLQAGKVSVVEGTSDSNLLYVPIILNETPIGVLRVVAGYQFSEEQSQLLGALADYIAIGVELERRAVAT